MQPRPSYDKALKRLLTEAHDEFLSLIYPGVIWRGELSPELPGVSRQADLVWDVADHGERVALHIELQTNADPEIGERVAEYAIRLWRRDHLPVRSFVIYLRPAQTLATPPFVMASHGQDLMRYDYRRILLWELDPAPVLATDQYHLWPLTALMAGVTPEAVGNIAERIIAAPLPRAERAELTGLLVLLAGVHINKTTLLHVLRRNGVIEDIWKESSFAGAVYEIGHEEGKEQGRSEGQLDALHQLAQAAVAGKFPDAPPETQARIAALTDQDLLRKLILEIGQIVDLAAVQELIDGAQEQASEDAK